MSRIASTPRPPVNSLPTLHKILGAVIDRNICAVIEARPAFLVGAGGGQYLGAEGLRELDRGNADAARPALHEKDFAPLQMHPLEDIGPDGGEGLGQTAGIDDVATNGHRQALPRR